jgi:hypothetical protein
VVEEQRPDPPALMLVGDREGDLRGMGLAGQPRVPADADDVLRPALAQGGDERGLIDEVEPGEAVELLVGEAALRAEEAEIDRARAQAVEVLDEAIAVVGTDGADEDRAAVTEDLLGRVLA